MRHVRDVGDHVADLAAGREHLSHDVRAVLGEHLVDRCQHARHVPVEMGDAPHPGVLELEVGQVHAQGGRAGADVVAQLARHELADGLLRLLGRAADVGREDDVGQAPQLGLEPVAAVLGLDREDIDGRATQMARQDVLPERPEVHHEAT